MAAPFEGPLFKSTFSFFIYIKKADFCPPSSPMRVLIPRLFPCPAWTLSLRASNPLKFAPAKKKNPMDVGSLVFSLWVSPRPRELPSEGRSDSEGSLRGRGLRCRALGAELDLAAPRSLELRPAPSCGAERWRGRAKVQRRQRSLCGRDFFSRGERRNRAALLPPGVSPQGAF